jgi:hypothetical protein
MARLRGHAGQSGISTGTSAKTILQLVAASNHRAVIEELSISFKGVVATDPPVLVEIVRQTTAGTMSALTPVKKVSTDDEALQTTAQHTATAEPTTSDVLKRWEIHPQTGLIWQARPGDEIVIPGGGRVAVRVTTTVTQTVTVGADFEE